jgi:hypothetical protein
VSKIIVIFWLTSSLSTPITTSTYYPTMPESSVWYCCKCKLGPWNITLDVSCPNCDEPRCFQCDKESVDMHTASQMLSHRQNFSSIGNTHTCNKLQPAETLCNQPVHLERTCIAPSLTPTARRPLMPEPQAMHTYNIFNFGGLLRQMPSNFYYCCQCNDGPKMYENQPMCVSCCHTICYNCRPA